MAFGFRRASGTSRGYVNETSPDFAPGQRLSRRQYDKYVESLGKRSRMPGVDAIRDAERNLERISAQLRELEAREADLSERERRLAERERLLSEREAEARRSKLANQRSRQSAGQRRYNTLLEAYVSEQRRRGNRSITKRQAAQSSEFKQIVKDVKGKPNPKNNPNIRDQNRFARMKALDKVGGSNVFREFYDQMFGPVIEASPNLPAYTPRTSFSAARRGQYQIRRRVA
jgi:aminopeptidase N